MTMTPTAETLALEFRQELRASMTAEQLALAAMRNVKQPNRYICQFHDSCDANTALHAAFIRHSIDTAGEGEMDRWIGLWNSAWNIAKTRGLKLALGDFKPSRR